MVPSVEALTIARIAPPLPVLLLRRLEDFYLHLLPSEQPLELPNPLLGLSQSAGRDDIFIRAHGRGRLRLDPALPSRITLGWMSGSRLTSTRVLPPSRVAGRFPA